VQENGTTGSLGNTNGTNSGSTNMAAMGLGLPLYASGLLTDTVNGTGTPRFSSETRPVNVYVNFIIKL
jgi:hypothetical protein